jgi:hypothetical protein
MSDEAKVEQAQCCCGEVSLKLSGGPKRVLACSCDYCQRRTGSIVQFSAWYTEDQFVTKTGEPKHYQSPDNPGADYMFCPHCGSTVYWEMPGLDSLYGARLYGVAVGGFADPDYPRPTIECWSSKRHRWLNEIGSDEIAAEFPAAIMEVLKNAEPGD